MTKYHIKPYLVSRDIKDKPLALTNAHLNYTKQSISNGLNKQSHAFLSGRTDAAQLVSIRGSGLIAADLSAE